MTINKIIAKLIAEGHDLTFRKRKDGGYIITSINGQKYQGSRGNEVARAITGETISQARIAQLRRIRPRKPKLDERVKKEIVKAQRLINKYKPKGHHKVATKDVRKYLEEYGVDATLSALEKQQMYAKGIAYQENVDNFQTLLGRIVDNLPRGVEAPSLITVIEYLGRHDKEIREEWLSNAIGEYYRYDQLGINNDDNAERLGQELLNEFHIS